MIHRLRQKPHQGDGEEVILCGCECHAGCPVGGHFRVPAADWWERCECAGSDGWRSLLEEQGHTPPPRPTDGSALQLRTRAGQEGKPGGTLGLLLYTALYCAAAAGAAVGASATNGAWSLALVALAVVFSLITVWMLPFSLLFLVIGVVTKVPESVLRRWNEK